jgi:hypothetical protein
MIYVKIVESNDSLKSLQTKINDEIYELTKGSTNAVGEKFSIEIVDIKPVNINVAMIIYKTKRL